MKNSRRVVVWFRQDLRLHDNEALNEAIFDYEQKIAQIDLEVETRIEAEIEKKRNEDAKKFTKSVIENSKNLL